MERLWLKNVIERFFLAFGVVFFSIVAVYIFVDYSTRMGNFALSLNEFMLFYVATILRRAEILLPITAAIACFFTAWYFGRLRFIQTLSSAGVSFYKILKPFYLAGFLVFLLLFLIQFFAIGKTFFWLNHLERKVFSPETARVHLLALPEGNVYYRFLEEDRMGSCIFVGSKEICLSKTAHIEDKGFFFEKPLVYFFGKKEPLLQKQPFFLKSSLSKEALFAYLTPVEERSLSDLLLWPQSSLIEWKIYLEWRVALLFYFIAVLLFAPFFLLGEKKFFRLPLVVLATLLFYLLLKTLFQLLLLQVVPVGSVLITTVCTLLAVVFYGKIRFSKVGFVE